MSNETDTLCPIDLEKGGLRRHHRMTDYLGMNFGLCPSEEAPEGRGIPFDPALVICPVDENTPTLWAPCRQPDSRRGIEGHGRHMFLGPDLDWPDALVSRPRDNHPRIDFDRWL
jgi:hypothetical protein